MRIDKFLKMSRVIKRRTVANEVADNGRISVNGKIVKPSYDVKIGDIVEIQFGDKVSKIAISVPFTLSALSLAPAVHISASIFPLFRVYM